MAKTVDFEFWLALSLNANSSYPKPNLPRLTLRKPALGRGEIPVKVTVAVPQALFKQPHLSLKFSLPEPTQELTVDIAQQEAIAEAIQEQLGVHVTVETTPTD